MTDHDQLRQHLSHIGGEVAELRTESRVAIARLQGSIETLTATKASDRRQIERDVTALQGQVADVRDVAESNRLTIARLAVLTTLAGGVGGLVGQVAVAALA